MRVYLDTNILAFMVGQDRWTSIGDDVRGVIKDYDTLLLSSSVCFAELVHLIQIGKVRIPGQKDVRKASVLALKRLEELGVSMVPTTMEHIKTLMELPLYDDHRDPNDRLIIAQAMSDRVTLISSDRKFMRYGRYGLDFIFNER
ncbi:MAG TPA: type II toxin-antitoxin system VapC family toxin [Candidatus Prevotella stercoripullorum]|nr:type II toxin-antitoxin system VapC family toxin [Candidatus Prevotella stercoripullorum]